MSLEDIFFKLAESRQKREKKSNGRYYKLGLMIIRFILTLDRQRVSLLDRREMLFDLGEIIIVLAIVMPVANASYPTDYNQHKNIKERD